MIDLDNILGNKKKKKSKGFELDSIFKKNTKSSAFNMDKILPKEKPTKEPNVQQELRQNIPKKLPKGAKIEIHNHYHGYPLKRQMLNSRPPTNRKFMSSFESTDSRGMPVTLPKGFEDKDGDGVPAYLDPDDNDPNNPRPMTSQRPNKRVRRIMNDILGED